MILGAQVPMAVDWDFPAVRDLAREAESAGIDFLSVSGHVLSTASGAYPNKPAVVYEGPYYDPLVLFTYLAEATDRLRLRTSVLILPLFPTALIAKQLAELSLLSGGRVELGVSISWNDREYRALGQDLHQRGRRLDEQLVVLRSLWTNDHVSFVGEFHHLQDVGIGRRPEVVPPVWLGGTLIERNLQRIVQHADGWIPSTDPSEQIPLLKERLRAAGRNPDSFGITARLDVTQVAMPDMGRNARRLHDAGVTHLVLDPGYPHSAAEAAALVSAAAKLVRESLEDQFPR